MIGKVMHNSSFLATTKYVLEKEQARIIGGNMGATTTRGMVREFMISHDINQEIKAPVWHMTLSLPHHESLDDEQFSELATKYFAGMVLAQKGPAVLEERDYQEKRYEFMQDGIFEYQFLVARHSDREHDHVHIVASRINVSTGLTVEVWRDACRSQAIIRQLEQEYGLQAVPCSWEVGKKARSKSQLNRQQVTGQDTVISMLQQHIDQAAADSPTMPVLIERLQQQGVGVWVHFVEDRKARKAGRVDARKVQGISYSLNGVSVSGSGVGARYSFNGLQKEKYAGVSYDPERDDEAIRDLLNRQTEGMGTAPPTTETLQDNQDSNGEQGNGTDDTGPEWKLLPSFANIRHAQEAIAPTEEPDDTESTDGDDEDSGMGGRTRQTDDEDGGSQDLLDAVEGERLLEQVYSAPTEPIEPGVVRFTGTPDSDRAETVAEFDDRTEPVEETQEQPAIALDVEETQEPPAIALDEDDASTDTYIYDTSSELSQSSEVDTYIYDTSPEASQPPEVSDPLKTAKQKLPENAAQELSDDERQLLRKHYRTVYENLKARVNDQLTGQKRDRAVVKWAIYSGRFTDSELVAIAVMGDYAQSIEQESGNKEKVREEAVLLVKEVKAAVHRTQRITKKRQTDQER